MKPELTVIIPFLNEGVEIRNTVKSIRDTAGNDVNILLINDASEDGYDYKAVADEYNTSYYHNEERKGVAGSRDFGVSLTETPYFILIDGHMRFYHNNWWIEVVKHLKEDDRAIYSCQCITLGQNGEKLHDKRGYGTYIDFLGILPYEILNAPWISCDVSPNDPIIEIPCVMGASYAVSKRYWMYIQGLAGLRSYGLDEQYMSLKTWLEGGRCALLKNIEIGHIFRTQQPYLALNADSIYNKLLIAETILPNHIGRRVHEKIKSVAKSEYYLAHYLINKHQETILSLKEYYKSIFTKDFDSFLRINNRGKNNPDIYNRLTLKLEEIAKFITSNPSNHIGLMNGEMGEILFLYEYANYKNDPKISDHADERLSLLLKKATSSELNHYNLNKGAAGLGIALRYLNQKEYVEMDVEMFFEDIEPSMNEYIVEELNKGNIDFFHQALGVEYYFTKKEGYEFANIPLLLQAVDNALNDDSKEMDDAKTLLFIAYIYQLGCKGEQIEQLIQKLITRLQIQKKDRKQIYDSGTFISLYALHKAASIIADNSLHSETLTAIIQTTNNLDAVKGYVWDAGINRGSAGTALIYYLLFLQHNTDEFHNAAAYWLSDILDKAIAEEGIAGFISFDEHSAASFLHGAAGVGLTILSMLKGEEPDWKEFLLL